MQTLKYGSKGEAVKEWQRILGFTGDDVDGDFGPKTLASTQQWQTQHKLVPDGVVGELTWGAAGKKVENTGLPPKSSSASTDAWAYAVSKKAAPDMPENERQYVLTVARGEGFYGKGWNPQPHPLLPNPDVNAAKTSNNWGAVQGTGSAGSFKHIDHHADGSPYVGTYKRYATPEEGFLSMANIILKGGKRGATGAAAIKDALKKGSLRDAVFAQHANGYFELNPEKYLSSAQKNYNQLTANLEWQDMLTESGHKLLNWGKWALIGIAAVGASVFTLIKTNIIRL